MDTVSETRQPDREARPTSSLLDSAGLTHFGGVASSNTALAEATYDVRGGLDSELRSRMLASVFVLLYRYGLRKTMSLGLRTISLSDNTTSNCETSQFVSGKLPIQELISRCSKAINDATNPISDKPVDMQVLIVQPEFAVPTDRLRNIITDRLFARHNDSQTHPLQPILCIDGDTVSVMAAYDPALADAAKVQQFVDHLSAVLNHVTSSPDKDVAGVAMLSPTEINQQLQNWQGQRKSYPTEPVFREVERLSESQPEASAVESDFNTLTYRQVNARSNKISHMLHGLGVVKGDRVCVCLRMSTDVIASMLGIFKLGAVYVPVDADHPAQRIATVVEDCGAICVIAESKTLEVLAQTSRQIVNLSEPHWLLDKPEVGLEVPVEPEDAAYVIYTSGSTGRPKGVLMNHANLINNVWSSIDQTEFSRSDKMPVLARHTFSITMFETLSPLVAGGTLRIVQPEDILETRKLLAHLSESSIVHIGPSLLKRVMDYLEESTESVDLGQIKCLFTGGDVIPASMASAVLSYFPNAKLFTNYGCSESSATACNYVVPRDVTLSKTVVGRPISNTYARIYDEDSNLLPNGVIGEVYLGGAGISPGYLNLPDQTAEKFVRIDGIPFFRTGDLGRWNPEGQLEIIGRQDFQVKVRGIRVEVLEVEQTLREAPHVDNAIVMPAKTPTGDDGLYAYIIGDIGADEIGNIRKFVEDRLPDYMRPNGYIALDALPLNPNGKIDRNALPAPDASNVIRGLGEQPITATQKLLARIWAEILSLPEITLDEDFQDLGGTSLLAAKAIDRTNQAFDVELSIRAFIEAPTLRQMAQFIDDGPSESLVSDAVCLKRGTNPPILCLYGVMLYRDLALALDDNQPLYSIFLQEEVDLIQSGDNAAILEKLSSIEFITAQYVAAIRATQPEGPYYLAGESFGGIIALEVARILTAASESVPLVALMDTWCPGFERNSGLTSRLHTHLHAFLNDPTGYPRKTLSSVTRRLRSHFLPNQHAGDKAPNVMEAREIARAKALSGYRATPYHGHVVLYRASEREPLEPEDRCLGWSKILHDLDVVDVPGDHLGILEPPNVSLLAEHLGGCVKS